MRLGDLDALKARLFSYYSFVNENTQKSTYKGDTLMDYEVASMIEDCLDSATTIDPVKAAGGCYCRECKEADYCGKKVRVLRGFDWAGKPLYKTVKVDFCSYGKSKEAQDD